ncbi:hypothetical protein [Falsirhodobacter sp. alg1]|uniref:hypothetical protein n=1 Tax=Falsirhodobacter sp. alg1 TaxID=1472418 RepID=UPI0005F05C8C|nr:hypothetical protein [Falsirhodobacter sp. alg1]
MTHITGHFGEFMQGRLGPDGPVVLITLPCPNVGVTLVRRAGPFALHGSRIIAPRTARTVLNATGQPLGQLHLRATMPVGGGAGSSTAAILALAGKQTPEFLAALCLSLEGAVDPLMYAAPEQLLWASRHGAIMARLPQLPRMQIVGGFLPGAERTDPADTRFPDISDLVQEWAEACSSAGQIARLASSSAARTQALRGPKQDPTPEIARRTGALGWLRAHTGTARAVILPPAAPVGPARNALLAAGLRGVTSFKVGT